MNEREEYRTHREGGYLQSESLGSMSRTATESQPYSFRHPGGNSRSHRNHMVEVDEHGHTLEYSRQNEDLGQENPIYQTQMDRLVSEMSHR